MPVAAAIAIRYIIMAAVQLGLWTLIEKYGIPLLNAGVVAIMKTFGVPEQTAKDIMANKIIIAFEEVGIFAATLRTKLPIVVAEYLGFTSKGYTVRTLSQAVEVKLGSSAIAATSKAAATAAEVSAIAEVVSASRKLSVSPIKTLLDYIFKYAGLTTGIFFAAAQYIDFANWQGPYQKVFQGVLSKFGINPDTPLPRANTISADNWKRLYSVIEELKPLGISFPFSDKDKPYSRQNLSDAVDEIAANMTLQGINPTYKNVIAVLLPLVVLENKTRTDTDIDTILNKISTATAIVKTASASTPSVKVFTGIVSQGVVGTGLVFTPRPDDLINDITELKEAAINNLASYLNTLLRKIVYEVKIVSSITGANGFKQTGTTQRIQTGTFANGTPKYKTVTNKFATLIIYAVTDKGSRAKLSTIVLGPVDSAKLIVGQNDLQALQDSLPKEVTTTNINEITSLVSDNTVAVSTPQSTPDYVNNLIPTTEPKVLSAAEIKSKELNEIAQANIARDNARKAAATPANFQTTSPKNAEGEIINPTAEDIRRFNEQFTTIKPKPGTNATNLSEWYTANGQALPPLSVRAEAYQALGLGQASYYTGTAEQNWRFLNALKK